LQKSNDKDFYNLETLCHFLRVKASGVSYLAYVKLATEANLDLVLYKDEGPLLTYLHGRIGDPTPGINLMKLDFGRKSFRINFALTFLTT
jgi:hypothetical protein